MSTNIAFQEDVLRTFRVRLVRGLLLFSILVSVITLVGMTAAPDIEISISSELLAVTAATAAVLLLLTLREPLIPYIYTAVPLLIGLSSLAIPVLQTRIVILLLATALGGIMLSRTLFLGMVALNIISFVAVILAQTTPDQPATEIIGVAILFLGLAALPIILGSVALFFTLTLQNALETARTGLTLLENSAGIGGLFSQVRDERLLASIAVEAIQQNFGVEHVQVFLLSKDRGHLRFVAGTGVGEANLLASQYALPIETPTALTRAVKAMELILVRGAAAQNERNRSSLDFLPSTRIEIIFPVRDKDEILGVIDIQSSRNEVMPEAAIKGMQILMYQFAAALQTAYSFQEQERSMLENKRLFLESQSSLREIERLNQQLTREVWAQYLETRRRASGITLDEQTLLQDAPWTEGMVEASRRRRPIRETQANNQRIAMPIELRGEVIGAVEIETAQHSDYDATIELMRAVSQRLANSLETARLFEVERETSVQEQRLSNLVAQYQSAATVDELLQITLQELATTLGVQDGSIRLGILEEQVATIQTQPQGGEPA